MVIAQDLLELLQRDKSKRAAHYACLKATPFCKESETLQHGVRRLDEWLTISAKLDHRPLNKVVVIVLACFMLESVGRVTCAKDLNDAWLDIARSVVSPCATTVDESYLRDARMTALFTLYKYLPGTYKVALMSVKPTDATSTTRAILEELQRIEMAEQAKRNVVSKLVESAIRNVIKGAKEHAKVQRLRCKKERRRLAESVQNVSLDDPVKATFTTTEEVDPTPLNCLEVPADTGSAADECVVCLDPIGSKRPLFTCGHARCCSACAPIVQECPMCRQPVRILMHIFV